jgi:glycosyltransferase involved in cell wall biosynthesis
MYRNNKVGIFVPAYNEEENIGEVLDTMPDYVDIILVVDDCSKDDTIGVVKKHMKKDKRIVLEANAQNQGNGYGAKLAYQKLAELGADLIAPMAGDGQTEAQYLPRLLDPVVDDVCDFAKGNRFLEPAVYKKMPRYRYIGNIFVTMLNKFSTGYYTMYDSLNGYYVITADTIRKIDFDKLGNRYEFENSFWIQLNIANARGLDVSIPPVYKNEKSKIRLGKVVLPTLWTLLKGFVERVFLKYILFNFSPVGLFFVTGFLLGLFGLVYGIVIALVSVGHAPASTGTVMISIVPLILGFQLILQAIVLDIQNEPKARRIHRK